MVLKMVSAAVLAVAAGLGVANAQSANDFGGPRELPPASFKGQQYVDSRGCVFLRAGLSGRTNWVPRVTRDRKQLCGYPPTFAKQKIDVVEDAPRAAPAPAPVTGRRPIETVATTTTPPKIRETPPKTAQRLPAATYAAPPVVAAQPAPQRVVKAAPPVVAAAPAPRAEKVVRQAKGQPTNGCYAAVPVRETFALRGGGTITLCTTGNGDLTSARAPRLAGGAAAVAPSGFVESAGGKVAISSQDSIPKGYKKAWTDDRLNPKRGQGTAQGWADQDQVWTRDVPAQSVEEALKAGKRVVIVRRVHVSSKSSPVELAAKVTKKASGSGKIYVQVGTFGQPSNADGAAARLRGAGLPVAKAKTTKAGKALQIVLAGPFASSAEAQEALKAARRAGFADAFIR
ncbi:SPOR domain-containing protein [Thioclava sp. FR2]|uniref:SPOR domain-containing protein n=1 Tax=Thioclava sp. FR2 TaxID=3445780 RepID=UPI003EBE32BC